MVGKKCILILVALLVFLISVAAREPCDENALNQCNNEVINLNKTYNELLDTANYLDRILVSMNRTLEQTKQERDYYRTLYESSSLDKVTVGEYHNFTQNVTNFQVNIENNINEFKTDVTNKIYKVEIFVGLLVAIELLKISFIQSLIKMPFSLFFQFITKYKKTDIRETHIETKTIIQDASSQEHKKQA